MLKSKFNLFKNKIKIFIARIRHRKGKKGVVMINSSIVEDLKEYTKDKNLKKKYINIVLRKEEDVRASVRRLFE